MIERDHAKPRPTKTLKRCTKCQGKWTVEEQGEQCPDCRQ